MASFNEDGLKKKLSDLNMSQQSIQTMSLWLIHHKKHAHNIVNMWFKELVRAPEAKKLALMYLANDVIQNSKKKGPEYNKEFCHRLPKAFKHLGGVKLGEKPLHGINRLLNVWDERGIFNGEVIKDFKKRFGQHRESHEKKKNSSGDDDTTDSHKAKKIRRESRDSVDVVNEDEFPSALESQFQPSTTTTSPPEEEVPAEPEPPAAVAEVKIVIEPEDLIKALQDLENAATADAEVRKKIASLPPSVSDLNGLNKLKDAISGRNLEAKVDEAMEMLQVYNKRLADEMEARKTVAKLLHDYISHQKDLLSQSEETLEEHRMKFNKVQKIRQELKAHLQNLPDISKLPNIGGGLAPLPSAGDLFT